MGSNKTMTPAERLAAFKQREVAKVACKVCDLVPDDVRAVADAEYAAGAAVAFIGRWLSDEGYTVSDSSFVRHIKLGHAPGVSIR